MTVRVDLIKHSYRQSKDGFVISFVLHPQDNIAELTNAAIGSQWQGEFTELDEDGNPDTRLGRSTLSGKRAGSEKASSGPARSWDEKSPAEQTGILRNDPDFRLFLGVGNAEAAAEKIRELCNVKSCADINPKTLSGRLWLALEKSYRNWRPGEGEL